MSCGPHERSLTDKPFVYIPMSSEKDIYLHLIASLNLKPIASLLILWKSVIISRP